MELSAEGTAGVDVVIPIFFACGAEAGFFVGLR
jgi:hypothetical protein